MHDPLFHRHRLREVSRLIRVDAASGRCIVGQQLADHDHLKHREFVRYIRDMKMNIAQCRIGDALIPAQKDDIGASRLRLTDIGNDLPVDIFLRGDRDHGNTVLNKGNRSVLELTRRIGLRMNIRDLLELQSSFHRNPVIEAAADVEDISCVDQPFCECGDSVLITEHRADHVRNRAQSLDELLRFGN